MSLSLLLLLLLLLLFTPISAFPLSLSFNLTRHYSAFPHLLRSTTSHHHAFPLLPRPAAASSRSELLQTSRSVAAGMPGAAHTSDSRLFLRQKQPGSSDRPLRMFEVVQPIQEERRRHGGGVRPCASVHILRHSFANTFSPAIANYTPPDTTSCNLSDDCGLSKRRRCYSRIVLKWRGTSAGRQFDRIAGVWLGGVELLRTSTPEPSPRREIVWEVQKDVTKYGALLWERQEVVAELGNVVDSVYTGVYQINVTLDFFGSEAAAAEMAEEEAADQILPFSSPSSDSGRWFFIPNDTYAPRTTFSFPRNLLKAVLELYVSFHGSDEFWYTNPPNDYLSDNQLNGSIPGNGAFRELQIFLDDATLIGAVWPYPVIYTGGVVNLFWRPAAGIGAFNLPSYQIDLSPFVGNLTDGNNHTISVRVLNGLPHWLVDGSLHLWLDSSASQTSGSLLTYSASHCSTTSSSSFHGLNGSFHTSAVRSLSYSGFVSASSGNFSVSSSYRLRFDNSMVFHENTNVQRVAQRTATETEITRRSGTEISYVRRLEEEYPLDLDCVTTLGDAGNESTTTYRCNLSHALNTNRTEIVASGGGTTTEARYEIVKNKQVADGYIEVAEDIVKAGLAELRQEYRARSTSNHHGGGGGENCYSRVVHTRNSSLISDAISRACTIS